MLVSLLSLLFFKVILVVMQLTVDIASRRILPDSYVKANLGALQS